MGYIKDPEKLTEGGNGVVSSRKSDGTIHTTVYTDGRHVSWDTDSDGNNSGIHSTNQSTGTKTNYGSGPKK